MEYFLPIAEVYVSLPLIFLLSLFVGVLSGLFGVGGGFLMTPFLIFMGITSWRVMLGSVVGLIFMAFITNLIAPYSTNAMLSIPPHYHLVMGSFLFGTVFMATEPVTGAHTDTGRWIFGFLVGILTVIIRSINPAYPEGIMLAILLMNAFAPLIDYFVVNSNIKKR